MWPSIKDVQYGAIQGTAPMPGFATVNKSMTRFPRSPMA
jgi:hypothetical protein